MPLVSRTFDQLIDFTRTSAGTFVGSNGLIQTTPQSRNLLTFTQEFDNAAWTKTDTTVTANNVAAPDGTLTADTLTEGSAGTAALAQTFTATPANSTLTASIYLKRGNTNWVSIFFYEAAATGNRCTGWVNLATGTAGSVANGGTATGAALTVTSVGNDWYRVSLTGAVNNSATALGLTYCSASADASTTRVSGATYLAWGAQFEVASSASTYTRNFGGLFPPRFDYDPVTLAPRGLLIEEQRSNLLTYSQEFDNAAWTKSSLTITANSTAAPDGTTTADTVAAASTGIFRYARQLITLTNGVSYTLTAYFKYKTARWVWLLGETNADALALFDILNGVVGSARAGVTHSMVSVGNGWYRCTATFTVTSATGAQEIGFGLSDTNTTTNPSATAGIDTFVWGAQLEAGAFATSYIPTVASQVTRSADNATMTGTNFASWYNQSEGTLVVEASTAQASTNRIVEMSGGTSSRVVDLLVVTSSGSQVQMFNGTAITTTSNALTLNQPFKTAGAYKTADYGVVLNGGTVASATDALVNTANALQIGRFNAATNYLNGHIRSIRYYPVRLTNAQLQSLTA